MKAIGSLVNSAKNAAQNIAIIGAVVARSIKDGFFEIVKVSKHVPIYASLYTFSLSTLLFCSDCVPSQREMLIKIVV